MIELNKFKNTNTVKEDISYAKELSRIEIAFKNGIDHRVENGIRIFEKGNIKIERQFLVDISIEKMESIFGKLKYSEEW